MSVYLNQYVEVKPQELKFPFELHKEIKCSFDVANITNEHLAFKVRSTRPQKYQITPDHGLLQPGSNYIIDVTMHAHTEAPIGMICTNKILVQTFVVEESMTVKTIDDISKIIRNDGWKLNLREVTLPIAYVQEYFGKPETIEEEEEGEGEEKEEILSVSSQNPSEMEASLRAEVQKIREELSKIRKESEENKKLVKELQLKLGYTKFEFRKLKEITKNFDDSCKIGKGGFSVVYKGILDGKEVAIKKLTVNDEKGFKEEIETLSKVRHPNIITLIGACEDKENRALIYEYLPGGSLEYHLNYTNNGTTPLSGHARIRIALDICCALSFLHSIPRAHGDLKPDNILLDSNFVSKLADFGTSRKLEHTKETMTPSYSTVVKGTPPYMDPDFSASGQMNTWFDVYSFGVVLLQLATGKDLYNMTTRMTLRESVTKAIKEKNFHKLVDVEWPSKEAPEKMAKLGLQCFESRWSESGRPDATKLFNSLMDIASNK